MLLASIYEVPYRQIYVIGSSSKLGLWKIQNGLKLRHSGESVWHADCVLPKGDFPIKYPCGCYDLQ